MWGMTCVILAVGLWLMIASFLEMPVSTTHSCVGGIIGMTMMARGASCVVWNAPNDAFPFVDGVTAIIVSWVLSPVASGVCSAIFYGLTYVFVLKNPENSFERAKYAFPFIVGFTVCVNVIFFVLKGTKGRAEELGTADIVSEAKDGNLLPVTWVGLVAFAVSTAIAAAITPTLVKKIENRPEATDIEVVEVEAAEPKKGADEPAVVDTSSIGVIEMVKSELNADPLAVLAKDDTVGAIHDNVSRHDPRCEEMFKFVQVFTAIVGSFSHGANDVSNAMGPFSAVYMTYKSGAVSSSEEVGDDMYWILCIGGVGIVVGLATYGYKIMSVIGVKLIAITPSRGYCIELGAAFVVIYGTSQGWPLSTTHCQVGATVGVGLFEGRSGVNLPVLLKCIAGWVLTLLVVGVTAAMLVGPNPNPIKAQYCDYETYDWTVFDTNSTA
jgi:sodium-dependent phosphate transporter